MKILRFFLSGLFCLNLAHADNYQDQLPEIFTSQNIEWQLEINRTYDQCLDHLSKGERLIDANVHLNSEGDFRYDCIYTKKRAGTVNNWIAFFIVEKDVADHNNRPIRFQRIKDTNDKWYYVYILEKKNTHNQDNIVMKGLTVKDLKGLKSKGLRILDLTRYKNPDYKPGNKVALVGAKGTPDPTFSDKYVFDVIVTKNTGAMVATWDIISNVSANTAQESIRGSGGVPIRMVTHEEDLGKVTALAYKTENRSFHLPVYVEPTKVAADVLSRIGVKSNGSFNYSGYRPISLSRYQRHDSQLDKKLDLFDMVFVDNGEPYYQTSHYKGIDNKLPGMSDFEKTIRSMLAKEGVPGAQMTIFHKGRMIYGAGYGLAKLGNLGQQELATVEHKGVMASVSKTITGMATLEAIKNQNKWNLDSKVFGPGAILSYIKPLKTELKIIDNHGKYTPPPPVYPGLGVNKHYKSITVRQLLNHTAGMGRDSMCDYSNERSSIRDILKKYNFVPNATPKNVRARHVIAFLLNPSTEHCLQKLAPEISQSYSNNHYLILGEVLTALTGKSYLTSIREFTNKYGGDVKIAAHSPYMEGFDEWFNYAQEISSKRYTKIPWSDEPLDPSKAVTAGHADASFYTKDDPIYAYGYLAMNTIDLSRVSHRLLGMDPNFSSPLASSIPEIKARPSMIDSKLRSYYGLTYELDWIDKPDPMDDSNTVFQHGGFLGHAAALNINVTKFDITLSFLWNSESGRYSGNFAGYIDDFLMKNLDALEDAQDMLD